MLQTAHAALALHFSHYNFCRIHESLRITPAMAARITGRVWEISGGMQGRRDMAPIEKSYA